MKRYLNQIKNVKLFKGIAPGGLLSILQCLKAEIKVVPKEGIVLLAGSKPEHVGVVLLGELHIVKEDFHGNRTLVSSLYPGDIFAEALCCAGAPQSPVTVQAECDSTVMLLKFTQMVQTCPSPCSFHTTLIQNMLQLLAQKNLYMQSRMEIISQKTIRAKLIQYFDGFTIAQGKNITLPLNREKMAEYLCVDRSALSHELIKMKRDGLLDYHKNNFTIKW